MQLVSKIADLCDHDPPTLQMHRRTDRQTDRQPDRWTDNMQSQDRAMHYSASRSNKLIWFNYSNPKEDSA